jgi:DNA-directed RNA polymerase specialized sigma24 family protein
MNNPDENDPLLAPLLGAHNDEERKERTAALLAEHAMPVIDAILAARLRQLGTSAALEDLRGDVVVRLLNRLQRLLSDPVGGAISSFRGYAAVVAYHRLDDLIRRTQPGRVALGNRVRYLLTKDPEFAVWPGPDGELVAGLPIWRDEEYEPTPLLDEVPLVLRGAGGASPRELRELLREAFAQLGGPVDLNALIALFARVLRIEEASAVAGALPLLPSGDPGPLARLETQDYLRRLWKEIVALPVRQRLALLLNLRDSRGDSVARLLPATGIASLEEIARVLELDPAEFATLWQDLPVEDARLAELLGITRQQVINLRKSARKRLTRRMARN